MQKLQNHRNTDNTCTLCGCDQFYNFSQIDVKVLRRLWNGIGGVSVGDAFSGIDYMEFKMCRDCDIGIFAPAKSGDGRFYEDFSRRRRTYYQKDKFEFALAGKIVKPYFKVLEIGGGVGNLQQHINCDSYICLEKNGAAVENAASLGNCVIEGDIADYSRENRERFDVVCMFQVAEHVETPGDFIKNASVCLKTGGLLIVSVPDCESFIRYLPNSINNLPPHHLTWWNKKTLRTIGREYGFDVELMDIRQEKLDRLHYSSHIEATLCRIVFSALRKRPPFILGGRVMRTGYKMLQVVTAALVKAGFSVCDERGHTIVGVYRKI